MYYSCGLAFKAVLDSSLTSLSLLCLSMGCLSNGHGRGKSAESPSLPMGVVIQFPMVVIVNVMGH